MTRRAKTDVAQLVGGSPEITRIVQAAVEPSRYRIELAGKKVRMGPPGHMLDYDYKDSECTLAIMNEKVLRQPMEMTIESDGSLSYTNCSGKKTRYEKAR